jgi:hypothetical protein
MSKFAARSRVSQQGEMNMNLQIMTTRRVRVAAAAASIALLTQVSPVRAERDERHHNRAVDITFTKWITGAVFVPNAFGTIEGRALMKGFTGGDVPGAFVGEVLRGQPSANPALTRPINGLEAIYEVHDDNGDHVLTALIRGGTDRATGAAILDGVVLAGWRRGAPVHVEFQTMPAVPGTISCDGAPVNTTCFVGTIHVGRVPTAKD